MSGEFDERLARGGEVRLYVRRRTSRRHVVDYAVTLIAIEAGEPRTIRVYDGAHRINEMHRYTRDGGKEPGHVVHDGTLAEGMRSAIVEVRRGWAEMIEGWRR